MTVEQRYFIPDHDQVDEEISISRKKLGTSNLAQESSTLIQISYRRFHDISLFKDMKESAMIIQCASRMYKSRTNTIRFVRDGEDSPLVTLRGKYLCGNPADPREAGIVQNQVIEEKPCMIQRRTGRKPKVARLGSDSQSDKDPLLDPSGLPVAPQQLNRLTLDNTKRNSLYKTVKIRVEEVPLGMPRPGSPQRAWSKKPLHQKTELQLTDDEAEAEDLRLRWNKKLVFLDELKPKAPLDSAEICIPIKPILRRPRTPKLDSLQALEPSEIWVKKIVYADEMGPDYGVEDIMQAGAGLPPTKKGRRKKGPTAAPNKGQQPKPQSKRKQKPSK